ncbi:Yqey-like protein-domain-containing protein [Spinellus fusiger]|nr:Yqey-like protein-domain-containing protein [Spinellus fusiger]
MLRLERSLLTAAANVRQITVQRWYSSVSQDSLLEKLKGDRKQWMREKKQPELNVVKGLLSDYTYYIKSPNAVAEQSDNATVVSLVNKAIKRRQDAISQYAAGGRSDLAEQEEAELLVLKGYLPVQMTADDIETHIRRIVQETGAVGARDMGKVMKAWTVDPSLADKKTVSDIVKKVLGV